jgi:hypothetical protein
MTLGFAQRVRQEVTSDTQYVAGFDASGTGLVVSLYKRTGNKMAQEPVWSYEEPTEKGVVNHVNQIALMIMMAADYVKTQGGALAAVGVASPGRFDASGIVKSGTNPHIDWGAESFNGINLKEHYQKRLREIAPPLSNVPMHVRNDAEAMAVAIVEGVKAGDIQGLQNHDGSPATLDGWKGKKIGMFGIGVGLGHTILDVDATGGYKIVTDGHASKLRVQVDSEDLPLLRHAKQSYETKMNKSEVLVFSDNTVRAEDLCRAPIIREMAGLSGMDDTEKMDISSPQVQKALQFAGKYLARTIALIRSGESQDINPENGWSSLDKAIAAQTSAYLVNGDMGHSALGTEVIRYASAELERLGIHDISLVHVPQEVQPARAAALLVPKEMYRETSRSVGG